ncbi:hypothetical protein MKZ38_001449 [Zalerion maritima]|uniref:DUF2461 domain-containing protein n=1 Tax=Zalerion maritima TaxID=339359 RepID=A0AAD5RZ11_9PEZI|nr:hypothetical protein MKZ38_001449 [Zalerion maritima]
MPPTKRQHSDSNAVAESSSRRRSQRLSLPVKKPKYAEDDSESVDKKPNGKAMKRGAKQESYSEAPSDSEDASDIVSDAESDAESEAPQPKSRKGRGKPKATPAKALVSRSKKKASKKVSEDEDEDGDDSDDSGVRKVFIKPHTQLTNDGGISYEDHKVHPNTVAFLKKLKANNNRPWLKDNDAEYRRSLKDWQSFVEYATEKIIDVDDTIPELPAKDLVFRIYRDIRFSNNPTPYKSQFSAAWSRTGKKGPFACYYVHLEPGSSFIGGGLYHPDNETLAKLRASIDERPQRWERALMDPDFRQVFFPDVKGGLDKMKKAFAARNQENALKVKPKGFIADHRDIELLKLRNFTFSKKIHADDLTKEGAGNKVADIVRGMLGFVTHLNKIVMPDPGDDSDSEDGDEGDEDEDDDEE